MKIKKIDVKYKIWIGALGIILYTGLLIFCMKYYTEPHAVSLTSDAKEVIVEYGGEDVRLEIDIYNNTPEVLCSSENIFCSYRIFDSQGSLVLEGARTTIDGLDTRKSERKTIVLQAPLWKGEYIVKVDLLEEGISWFEDYGNGEVCTVRLVVKNNYGSNISAKLSCDASLVQNDVNTIYIPFYITNTGKQRIHQSGLLAAAISYHIKTEDGQVLLFEGKRQMLFSDIEPGDTIEAVCEIDMANLILPQGRYVVEVELLQEGIVWGSDMGITPLEILIER